MDSPQPTSGDGTAAAGAPGPTPPDMIRLDPPPPSWLRRWIVAVAVLVVTALTGFLLGWIWWTVAPRMPAEVRGGALYFVTEEPEQLAASEGWFVLLSLGTGIIFAVLAWVLLRRYRGPLTLGGLAIGSLITGWLAWRFGHTINYGAFKAHARSAPDGTIVRVPPNLRVRTGFLSKHDQGFAFWHGIIPYIGGSLVFVALAAVAVYLILATFAMSPSLGLHKRAEAMARAEDEARETATGSPPPPIGPPPGPPESQL